MSKCKYLDDETHECKLGHKIPPGGCGKDCEWFEPGLPEPLGPPEPPGPPRPPL